MNDGHTYWQDEQTPTEPLSEENIPSSVSEASVAGTISWQASEYIHHEKDALWFGALALVTIALLVASYFLLHSWTFMALLVVMAVSVVVYSRRPPRTLTYTLSPRHLQINERTYDLSMFRAFGVVQDGPFYFVSLVPVKRFLPAVNVYFPVEQGEQIVDTLGASVPMEELQLDMVDRLVRKLRF